MELLKIDLIQGEPSVLQIDGEVDLATAEQLRSALEEALAADPHVVVDLARVTFFDATGIRVLLQVAETLNGAGPLQVMNAGHLAHLLELVGLSDLTSIQMLDVSDARGR